MVLLEREAVLALAAAAAGDGDAVRVAITCGCVKVGFGCVRSLVSVRSKIHMAGCGIHLHSSPHLSRGRGVVMRGVAFSKPRIQHDLHEERLGDPVHYIGNTAKPVVPLIKSWVFNLELSNEMGQHWTAENETNRGPLASRTHCAVQIAEL